MISLLLAERKDPEKLKMWIPDTLFQVIFLLQRITDSWISTFFSSTQIHTLTSNNEKLLSVWSQVIKSYYNFEFSVNLIFQNYFQKLSNNIFCHKTGKGTQTILHSKVCLAPRDNLILPYAGWENDITTVPVKCTIYIFVYIRQ